MKKELKDNARRLLHRAAKNCYAGIDDKAKKADKHDALIYILCDLRGVMSCLYPDKKYVEFVLDSARRKQ